MAEAKQAYATELRALIDRHGRKLTDAEIIRPLEECLDDALAGAGDVPITDVRAMLAIPAHKLADMLRESEPHRQPDDGDTEMEITVEDARRIAWALIGHAPDRDDILRRIRAALAKAEAQ